MKKKLFVLIPALLTLFVASCGESSTPSTPTDDTPTTQVDKEFTNVSFEDLTFTYDGNAHILGEVKGAPEGTKITYTGREEKTNVGKYEATAKLEKDGYKTKSLKATLTINPATITGITFNNSSIAYDGNPHTLDISGTLPQGGSVAYTNKGPFTDAGSYQIKAVVSAPNYNDLTLNATLTINKGTFTGVTFSDQTFEYDGYPHSIQITGTLPSTASVSYTSDVEGVTNSATNIGEYNITATITDKNFETLVLKAKLTIKTDDDERYLKWSGNTLFFQNALHDNLLYAYNSTDSTIVKASGDNAVDIIEYQDNSVMFVSKSLISSSIKTASYDSTKHSVDFSSVHSARARYVQYGGGNIIYYVVNGLTQNKSGIYKADLSGEEPVVTRLSVGKAKYLTLVGSKLYFADGENGYKFSSINTSGEDQTRALVVDEKINNLHYSDGAFYYTVNNLLGNYIEKYTVSNGRRKLTSDAGIDFCVIGGYLYYINVDKLNTYIYGEGIYKVSTNPLADNNSAGSKVIEKEKGICSLTTDGTNLYYYDMDGYKLVKASTSGAFIADLLDGFIKPEDPAPTTLGGDTGSYNGVLYYIDIWDGKSLHSYNPQTKMNIRLTANKVDNFSIIGDEIYINMLTNLVNNDTYHFNLKTGSEVEKINTYDGLDFVKYGNYLYYAQDNGVGVRTAIRRTNLETLVDEEVYNKGVSNLKMIGDKLYFIDSYQIYSMNLTTFATEEIKPENKSVHTDTFDTDGTSIYYRDQYSVGYLNKRLAKYNLSTSAKTIMASKSTDPISIVYHNNYVYYCNDASLSSKVLCKVGASTSSEDEGTSVLENGSTSYYPGEFTIIDNNIYFLNYRAGGLLGDSHMYVVSINGGTPEKIA